MKILEKEGFKNNKGGTITLNIVQKYIRLNGTVKTAIGQDKAEQSNLKKLVAGWVAEKLVKTERVKGEKGMTVKTIVNQFNCWAKANGKAAASPTVIGTYLIKNGFEWKWLGGKKNFCVALVG